MNPQSREYPFYDLEALLVQSGGRVRGDLVDAGMVRAFTADYVVTTSGESLLLSVPASRRPRSIALPRRIPLTPELLAFLGMYSGDGNKTGGIGFAQRNVVLLEAACRGLEMLFGSSASFSVNLLNDSRYFMRDEFADLLKNAGITADMLPSLRARDVPEALRSHLKSEFAEEIRNLPHLKTITNVSATVSPLKGAREPGGESREYIVGLEDSRWLLPLMLTVIEHLNTSLSTDSRSIAIGGRTVLDWGDQPSRVKYFEIDLLDYLANSPTCQWHTAGGKVVRYAVEISGNSLVVGGSKTFKVPRHVTLGPRVSYAAGLYLAEGTTDKTVLLSFDRPGMAGTSVALSFNSSEDTSLALFLGSLDECLGSAAEVLTSWKVKVGSQYMYEMQVLGELFQSPMMRQGPKGQGVSRSVVQAGFARDWAMQQFPSLSQAVQLFSHIEYTGAGIIRVQVTCSSASARLLFSLYRQAVGGLIPVAP